MPFAPGGDTAGETAESTAAPSTQPTVVIESTEFGFSPSTVTLTQGEEIVLRLVNNGLVEHNIDIPMLGVLLTAAPGETVETILVVPGSGNGGSFTCSLAGHAEAGMTGNIQIGLAVAESPDAETQVVAARIEMDETTGMPSITTAIILAMGMFLAMMAFVVGMLQFMKGFEEQL